MSEIGRVAPGDRRGEDLMAKADQNVTLSPSRDIPFDRLVLSQSNVRRIKSGVSVEELAEDIARNMSAISARVSPIPGKTVMGIELPNADRQMVSFKEMVASEAFAGAKGLLPIILGKDIAGAPVVADLAASRRFY